MAVFFGPAGARKADCAAASVFDALSHGFHEVDDVRAVFLLFRRFNRFAAGLVLNELAERQLILVLELTGSKRPAFVSRMCAAALRGGWRCEIFPAAHLAIAQRAEYPCSMARMGCSIELAEFIRTSRFFGNRSKVQAFIIQLEPSGSAILLLLEVVMTVKTAVSMVALTVALGFATEAMAQTAPAPRAPATQAPKQPVAGQILVQDANTILAKQDLIGQTVYAPDKAKIGSISDLVLSKDGKSVEGFLIGVGGFLGLGEKSVALKLEKLKMAPGADGTMQLSMDMTKDELSNTPTFQSKRDLDAEKAAEQRRSQQPARPSPITK